MHLSSVKHSFLGKFLKKGNGGVKPRRQNLGNVCLKIVILALFQVKFSEIAFEVYFHVIFNKIQSKYNIRFGISLFLGKLDYIRPMRPPCVAKRF